MSTRTLSPGGALLRRSKVFSMPRPLQSSKSGSLIDQTVSQTATTPYPTHISLTTPLSALKEGDWGLKRPLPLRTTTKSSSPSVRIEAIDTLEKVTSFKSSGDHAITLRKWQELDLPITTKVAYSESAEEVRRNVFEEDVDSLVEIDSDDIFRKRKKKWKFKGPWLAGQSDGEFAEYFKTHVKGHKKEFQEFLREECAKAKTIDARTAYTSEGLESEVPTFTSIDITDEELSSFTKSLRFNKVQLFKSIRYFFDIPSGAATTDPSNYTILNLISSTNKNEYIENNQNDPLSDKDNRLEIKYLSFSEKGPPKTHPSAGLSYLRSGAHLFNHHKFGPQQSKLPIQARVILPKHVGSTGSREALIGCAGFVTGVSGSHKIHYEKGFKVSQVSNIQFPGLQYLDTNLKGGSKSWVHLTNAEIDPEGCLLLNWKIGDPECVAIKLNSADEYHLQTKQSDSQFWHQSVSYKIRKSNRVSNAKQYGLHSMNGEKQTNMPDLAGQEELSYLISKTGVVR